MPKKSAPKKHLHREGEVTVNDNKPIYVISIVIGSVCLVLGNLGFVIAKQSGARVQGMVLGLVFWAAILLWGGVIFLIFLAGLQRVVKGGMTGLEFLGLLALNLLPWLALLGITLLLAHRG